MLYAKKGNKVVEIEERMKAHYINDGFNIYENGKVVEYGRGTGVAHSEYQKLLEENARLKRDIKALEEMLKAAETKEVETEEVETEPQEEVKEYKRTKKTSKKK